LPVLAATIAASKAGDLTFLVTERGTPFVKESFGNWFRDACREAGCQAQHTGSARRGRLAAENGATVHQIMALFGWKTEKMALIYTRKADRKRLTSAAAPLLLLPTQVQNENRPHFESGAGASEN
jgi:hypothetical protein